MSDIVLYETRNRKAYITLNRPDKRNALNPELVNALKEVLLAAARDTEVKVIVLRANGTVFCSGADLGYLKELQKNTFEENLEDSRNLKDLFYQIYRHPKPLIAQVHGHAIAGGCGLATLCDFVVAAEDAKFGYTEVRIGFVPALVTVFLQRRIGETHARKLLLTGALVTAAEAERIGLINTCVAADSLESTVEELAEELISRNSGQSMSMVKEMLARVPSMEVGQALEYAAEMNAKARETEDCKKGISSFLKKEKLQW